MRFPLTKINFKLINLHNATNSIPKALFLTQCYIHICSSVHPSETPIKSPHSENYISPQQELFYAPFELQVVRPTVRSFSQWRNLLQVTPFHPSCSHHRQTSTNWTHFLSVNNSRMTVLQTLVTVNQHNSPLVAIR